MTILAAAMVVVLGCSVGEPPTPTRPGPGGPAGAPADTAAVEPGGGAGGDAAAAAELLKRARDAFHRTVLDSALLLANEVVEEHGGTPPAPAARWLAARAAFALDRYPEARTLASGSSKDDELSEATRDSARELAGLAADAMEAPVGPAVVGAVLPRTGSRILVRYADWVLEGIRLAVQAAEQRQGRRIDLVVMDDGGGTRTREAVAELERQGALAIIGPLLPQQLSEAAGARRDDHVLIVSPTIPDLPTHWPRAFTVGGGDVQGARDLGGYAGSLGLGRAAVLFLNSPEFERQASAFAAGYQAQGGTVVATVPYDSGTTTFGHHLEGILHEATWQSGPQPFALFVAAPERDVPQIAPQISFYGLDSAGVQVFGDASWTVAPVRRLVPARDLEGVLAVSHLPPGQADGLASPDFVRLYEGTYRRSLGNQLPALGYDAANLVLQALPSRDLTPSSTALRFEFLAGVNGATGVLSVRGDQVVHTPFLVVIRDGALQPAPYPWEYALPVPKPTADGGGAR